VGLEPGTPPPSPPPADQGSNRGHHTAACRQVGLTRLYTLDIYGRFIKKNRRNEQYRLESTDRFMKGLAFSPSYDLAPPLLRLFRLKARPATHRKNEQERRLSDGRGSSGGGRGAESYDRKKAWFSINQSVLSGMYVANSNRGLHTPCFCLNSGSAFPAPFPWTN